LRQAYDYWQDQPGNCRSRRAGPEGAGGAHAPPEGAVWIDRYCVRAPAQARRPVPCGVRSVSSVARSDRFPGQRSGSEAAPGGMIPSGRFPQRWPSRRLACDRALRHWPTLTLPIASDKLAQCVLIQASHRWPDVAPGAAPALCRPASLRTGRHPSGRGHDRPGP
jgi:hypothetical protein